MKNADRGLRAVVETPSGRGAVAVVLVQGVHVAPFVGNWFRPAVGGDLDARPIGRIVYGRWCSDEHAGEDVVACRKNETLLEVHCHGGTAAVRRILDDLTAGGAEVVAWQDWRRTVEGDAIAAEADVALAQATTERAACILLDQRQGALRQAIEAALKLLEQERVEETAAIVAKLLSRAALGLHLVEPWRIVLCGPPNVGKSSLINALLGYERAIVFDQPGTTRDVVAATTAFDGWACELSDTAGLRDSTDELERAGIERARAQIARADLVVRVETADSLEWLMGDGTFDNKKLMRVWNKCDKAVYTAADPAEVLSTSAKTGAGIAELAVAMLTRLIGEPPASGMAVPFTNRQVDLLKRCAASLDVGRRQHAAVALTEILGNKGG